MIKKLPDLLYPGLIILLILAFLLKPAQTYAENPNDVYTPSTQEQNMRIRQLNEEAASEGKAKVSGELVSQFHLHNVIYGMTNLIACTDEQNCQPEKTALGNISYLMAQVYAHPPASFAYYAQDALANASIIPKAHAQGIGFAAFTPLLSIWKAARNISYTVIIIVMVVIGFMIIFRMKIDPKTVISLQAALPKIVITLVLITFSYAIVGLMIDLMYLVMFVLIDMLARGMGGEFAANVQKIQSTYAGGGIGVLISHIWGAGFSTIDDFLKGLGGGALVGAGVIDAIIGVLTVTITNLWFLLLGPAIIGGLFLLILVLGLLFTTIRLLMLLMNSYIQLIITTILAPLALLQEAIPGKSAFGQWMGNIIANLVVFPTTVAVLMFAQFLATTDSLGSLWKPPLIGIHAGRAYQAFLAISVIFMAPTLVAKVKKALKPKPILPISAGTALSPLTGGAQTVMGAMGQFYYGASVVQSLKGLVGGNKGGGGGQAHKTT